MEHILYWLWLTGLYGTASGKLLPLIEHFGSIESVYKSTTYPSLGMYSERLLQKMNNKSLVWAEKVYNTCIKKNISIIAYDDDRYPPALKNIFVPPVVLYTKGQIPDWDNLLMISIVGTRKATEYGLRITTSLCSELATKGVTLISGVATGIDSKAIESAVNTGAYSIMISPCGLDVNYPKSNEKLRTKVINFGLMISEYPPGMDVKTWHFKARNRIIAGISKGTLIVEAPGKSGALITARCALEENRDVFVVPGQIDNNNSLGVNNLLKDGAKPVFSAEDILSEYSHYIKFIKPVKIQKAQPEIADNESFFDAKPDKPKKQNSQFAQITQTGVEGEILKYLTENGECHIDTIMRELDATANAFQTAVFLLELTGTITRLPGNILKRVK